MTSKVGVLDPSTRQMRWKTATPVRASFALLLPASGLVHRGFFFSFSSSASGGGSPGRFSLASCSCACAAPNRGAVVVNFRQDLSQVTARFPHHKSRDDGATGRARQFGGCGWRLEGLTEEFHGNRSGRWRAVHEQRDGGAGLKPLDDFDEAKGVLAHDQLRYCARSKVFRR